MAPPHRPGDENGEASDYQVTEEDEHERREHLAGVLVRRRDENGEEYGGDAAVDDWNEEAFHQRGDGNGVSRHGGKVNEEKQQRPAEILGE